MWFVVEKEMKIFRLNSEQWIRRPLGEVFAFFSNPVNLETITPTWLQFEIKTKSPFTMQEGALINYSLRLHGLPLSWTSRITVWEPPRRFVDDQVKGPYRLWHHEHTFEEKDGGTLVVDHVDYAVLGGSFINKLLVARDVARIFEFRRNKLAEIFI